MTDFRLLLALLVCGIGCSHAVEEGPSPAAAAFAAAQAEHATLPAPGTAVAVVDRRGAKFLSLGVERVAEAAVSEDSVFQIASLTKPFMALVVLRLAEQGRLSLDNQASRWLPWLPAAYRDVTIRQLLSHTSGVPRDLRNANVDEFTLDEFRRRFIAAQPSFRPGERWEYSNTGYILLAMIAEEAGRRPLAALLENMVFRPAGMERTRYRAPLTAGPGRAAGYDWVEGRWEAAPPVYSGFGNSGIESTAADLARFARALHRGRLLKPASVEAMLTPAKLASGAPLAFDFRGAPTSYGLGWFLAEQCGTRVAVHGGAIAGFSSNLSWAIERGLSVAALANGKSGPDRIGRADKIAGAAMKAALGC